MNALESFLKSRDFLLNSESYDEAKSGFSWPKLTEFNWAIDYFDRVVGQTDRTAIFYVDDKGVEERVSYRKLMDRSNQVANFLKDLGFGKGDRILLILQNRVEIFELFLAAMKVGCPIIPASTLLSSSDIEDRIIRGRVKCIVTEEELLRKVDLVGQPLKYLKSKILIGASSDGWLNFNSSYDFPSKFKSEERPLLSDELLIYFTSGTTAKPKLVQHTYGSYPIGHLTTMYWIGLKKGDLHYNISAPGWAKHAWSTIFAAWNAEATSFVYNYVGKFDSKRTLERIAKHEVTTLCAPPTVWRLFLLEDLTKYSFSLREVVSAGEPLNPEIIERVKKQIGISIREGYGQTETTLQVGTFPGMPVKPGSMGVESPGFTVEVVDDTYKPVGEGREGAIAIQVAPQRPLGLMTKYIDPPEKNREVFVGQWYLTGDLAVKDKEGYFWFIGRTDDVFKSSDYRISPFEIESELLACDMIAESAVVPSPDRLKGFVPKAFIILKPTCKSSPETALEIFSFIRRRIAPYKRPRIIQFVSELPKTISGKIRRVELRKQEYELKERGTRGEDEYFESDFKA